MTFFSEWIQHIQHIQHIQQVRKQLSMLTWHQVVRCVSSIFPKWWMAFRFFCCLKKIVKHRKYNLCDPGTWQTSEFMHYNHKMTIWKALPWCLWEKILLSCQAPSEEHQNKDSQRPNPNYQLVTPGPDKVIIPENINIIKQKTNTCREFRHQMPIKQIKDKLVVTIASHT